ncbi:hypothetical protein LINPERPRIM_LOCUS14514 [Linum perenne]
MQFIYYSAGWEGSAHDGRVLRDALSRPNGFRVPQAMTKKDKEGRGYKEWNMKLDTLFIKVMKEMIDNGQMVNGNFKPEAYPQMEKMMEFKADPHLRSRHKTLKKQFLAVQLLKSESGYGWNDELKCLDIDDDIYDDFVKVGHPECAKLNRVPFSLYDDLDRLFVKTRAIGDGVKQITDHVPEPSFESNASESFAQESTPRGVNVSTEDVLIEDIPNDDNAAQTYPSDKRKEKATPSGDSTQSKKKSKMQDDSFADDITSKLAARFEPIINKTIESLGNILAEEVVVETSQKDAIMEELEKLEGLTEDQVVDAALILVNDEWKLRLFYKLKSDEAKTRFALHLIH